jgi:PAS domain S-box-containing protein
MVPGRKKLILIVDDEPLIAGDEAMLLEESGYSVLTASNGEEAVDAVRNTPGIDLILMDINLGSGMNGSEAAKSILKEQDIPVVFLSSHTEPETVSLTEGITSYGYIVKNSGAAVLLASIDMAFRLRESDARFRTAFEKVSVGMVLTSTTGELLRVNEAFASMLGYTVPEILSLNFSVLTHHDDVELSQGNLRSMLQSETGTCRFEKRYIHKNGNSVLTEVTSILLRDGAGDPLHFVTHVQDITEQKATEAALAESRDRLVSIFRAVPAGLGVVQGSDRVIIDANERVCSMTGYTLKELLGKSSRLLYPSGEDYEYVGSEKYRQIAKTGTGAVETRWRKKDGTVIHVLLASSPIHPEDINRGVTFTVMDISDRKRNEERILALVGEKETLLKEVQHRVKNTMNTMVSLLSLQAAALGDQSPAAAALNDARSRFRSMELLYDQLYRTEIHDSGSVREYLDRLVDTLVNLFPDSQTVTVHTDIKEFPLDVKRLSTLGLLVNELVTNAMKYAFPGNPDGRLLVSARREGGMVSVGVEDNGPGLPQDFASRVPSGLGISMVRALAEQLMGTVRFEQENGTRVLLEFPYSSDGEH